MFAHSIRVPRLYKVAAKIVQQVKEEGASVKQLVYQKEHPNIKAIYALVVATLQNGSKLDFLVRKSEILIKEPRLDPWLCRILMTELLWGKKQISGESKPVKTVLKYHEKFLEILSNAPEIEKSESKKDAIVKPRYVRVNTLKLSVSEAINGFINENWSFLRCGDGSDYAAYLATISSLSEDQFTVDIHLKDVLVFPPKTQFYQHSCYLNGEIILQDKASCLAPFLLSPPVGSTVLDMCSAPGMKASQLAAMVGKEGHVFAIERDQGRYETMRKLLEGCDASNVKCINRDVLTLTDKDIADIEYILVDPSCSGSGMLDRLEFEDPAAKFNELRLQKLAGFQITILRHALTNFSQAKRVIYSTCSLHIQENEEVIKQVLSSIPNFKLVPLKEKMAGKWYNFGSKDFEIGEYCLYARPEQDHTNGFFVAMFERIQDGGVNPYFVKRVKRASECENVENKNEKLDEKNNKDGAESGDKKGKKKSKNKNKKAENLSERNNKSEGNVTESGDKKGKKKKSKNKNNQVENLTKENNEKNVEKDKKEKSKNKNKEIQEDENLSENEAKKAKKCKKSKKEKRESNEVDAAKTEEVGNTEKVKKSKKKKNKNNKEMSIEQEHGENQVETKKTKKKKHVEEISKTEKINEIEEKPAKKRKHKHVGNEEQVENAEKTKKKKKKAHAE